MGLTAAIMWNWDGARSRPTVHSLLSINLAVCVYSPCMYVYTARCILLYPLCTMTCIGLKSSQSICSQKTIYVKWFILTCCCPTDLDLVPVRDEEESSPIQIPRQAGHYFGRYRAPLYLLHTWWEGWWCRAWWPRVLFGEQHTTLCIGCTVTMYVHTLAHCLFCTTNKDSARCHGNWQQGC